jgi:hypothetical protein
MLAAQLIGYPSTKRIALVPVPESKKRFKSPGWQDNQDPFTNIPVQNIAGP